MRREKTVPLGQIIEEWINQGGFSQKIHEASIVNRWSEIVGDRMARNTENLRIENNILYVKINSGLALQEMYIIREPLREKINQQLGYELLKDIVIENKTAPWKD